MMEDTMFKEERQNAILKIVETEGRITTSLIQRKFGVGYGTARNDLDEMAGKGLVRRTHAGAVPAGVPSVGYSPDIHPLTSRERCAEIRENYRKIAGKAAGMIGEEEVVFVTSASMGWLLAREIPESLRCTVVTNSSAVAEELRTKKNIRVFVTGGEMEENGNFYDDFTLSALKRLRFDKAFLTSAALSAGFGMSVQNGRNVTLTRLVIAQAREVVALYPAEKIGVESVEQICPAEEISTLVTEAEAPAAELEALGERGIRVLTV
ncbi:MAG: DeoR/GlpR transcriptional regulator [Clostridia bacterium]|nr:DeoR/GlpR transcriptional regulator [Clostridia bacterium]MBQ5355535.1 DeoR/GlpR transcriptional regulator [Clostridia bacterium]